MTLGEKIKELRSRSNMTQLQLGDKVNVTAQAVSRWEQNIVEPDIGTLKKLSELFSVSLDVLLSNKPIPQKEVAPQPIIVQHVNPTDTRRQIGVCENCNRPILEGEKIHRHYHARRPSNIFCDSCEQNRLSNIEKQKIEQTNTNRFWAFFWAILTSGFFFYLSMQELFSGNFGSNLFYGSLFFGYALFAFFFTINAKNTFLGSFFIEVASWGFFKAPGVLFSLDIDGLIFLLTVKIAFFFLGIAVSLAFGGFALALSLVLSLFVFPFSLYLSFTSPESTEI